MLNSKNKKDLINIPDGLVFSCKGVYLSEDEKLFFENTNPFGFILFSRNFESKEQIYKLIKQLKNVSKNKLVQIFVDQEGGRVQRFKNKEFINFPNQKFFGDLFKKNKKLAVKLAYSNARLIASDLYEVGVDINCSPVLDLSFPYANSVIGDRSFSSDPRIVHLLGDSYCKGFKDGGIFPVIKHFPGHGRAKVDSHISLPSIDIKTEVLMKEDIYPFKKLNSAKFIMLAHILYTQIDDVVSTYSSKLISKFLNKNIKYKGIILSDDISMKALKGRLSTRTKKAFNAGCDVILYCAGKLKEMEIINSYAKKIEVRKYVQYLKDKEDIKPIKINYDFFKAEFYRLLSDNE